MDSFLKGDQLHGMDTLMQFFKAQTLELEQGNDSVSQHLELIPHERTTAASAEEIEIATKVRNAEIKLARGRRAEGS